MLCLVIPHFGLSQDTVSLREIEVAVKKEALEQVGKKTETVDSLLKAQFAGQSVGDVLEFNSTVFIKNYGPGQLATTAFRGGNATQTAILWNGFNIQNTMLGQTDLSLLPASLFENVEVAYGGSSALWGSGAVGGSILLNNRHRFGTGFFTSTTLGKGSFGLFNASTNITISKRRLISSTKLYITDSRNDFTYRDTTDKLNPLKKQKNGEYSFKGLMQELRFLLAPRHTLSIHAWLSANQRRLPSFNQADGKTYQDDDAARITANWNYTGTVFRSVTRAGFFRDKIVYTDSMLPVFSDSRVRTMTAENENYLAWGRAHQFNAGVNITSSSANSTSYSTQKTLGKIALLAGNKFSFLTGRVTSYISLRAEYFSVGALPVTGNISTDVNVSKHVVAGVNVARVYRQPSLNELYWIPGGNSLLKPEEGYTGEGHLTFKRNIKKIELAVSGAIYSRKITNWILWVPGANGNPSPVNIQQVWSRGTESTLKAGYRSGKWNTGVALNTGYVLSTVEANRQENTNTWKRQLIYTPRYTVNGNCFIGYGHFTAVFFHQYTGYRFTASDNSEWLNPYHVSFLKINQKLALKELNVVFFAGCHNLFNTDYTVLAGRPMPLRYVEFGITLQSKHKNNN